MFLKQKKNGSLPPLQMQGESNAQKNLTIPIMHENSQTKSNTAAIIRSQDQSVMSVNKNDEQDLLDDQ